MLGFELGLILCLELHNGFGFGFGFDLGLYLKLHNVFGVEMVNNGLVSGKVDSSRS